MNCNLKKYCKNSIKPERKTKLNLSKISSSLKTFYPKIDRWALWLVILLVLLMEAYFFLKWGRVADGFWKFRNFLPFDSHWYHKIVVDGYQFSTDPKVQSNVAFFPIYPLLIKGTHFLTGFSYIICQYLVSFLSSLGSLILLFYVSSHFFNRVAAFFSCLFFLLYPPSFFLLAGYTESTFLFFIFAAILAYQKNLTFLAFLLAGLSTGTRSAGAFFSFALVLHYIFIHRPPFTPFSVPKWLSLTGKVIGYSLLSLSGILLYMSYLYAKFDDPVAFMTTLQAWGYQPPSMVNTLTFYHAFDQIMVRYSSIFKTLFRLPAYHVPFLSSLLILGNLFLLFFIRSFKLPWYLLVYGFIALLYPIYATSGVKESWLAMGSIGRYQLQTVFPFLILGQFAYRHPLAVPLLSISFFLIYRKLIALFFNLMWAG